MPSFQDSIVLFILALLLFGPKRLPVLARELGKWVGEFRRASNEFKSQMEEELRLSEQADRTKQIAAMEAAAPAPPPIPEPEHPHLSLPETSSNAEETSFTGTTEPIVAETVEAPAYEMTDGVRRPIPIATSGEVSIMPPSTGLPTPRSRQDPLGGLLNAIPETSTIPQTTPAAETTTHGD
jgi:sec-independent protein translocase protein TatB